MCFSAFAHGACAMIANALGILAACYGVLDLNKLSASKNNVPVWQLEV